MILHAVHTLLAQSTHCGSMALHGLTVCEGTGGCIQSATLSSEALSGIDNVNLFTSEVSMDVTWH